MTSLADLSFLEGRDLGSGYMSQVKLAYCAKYKSLYAIKIVG